MSKRVVLLLLVVAAAAAREAPEPASRLEPRQPVDFFNQAGHEDELAAAPLARARRQASDSVGSFLSELGAQMNKAQSSIESSAKSLADLFQPKSTPAAPKLPLLSRKRRQAAASNITDEPLARIKQILALSVPHSRNDFVADIILKFRPEVEDALAQKPDSMGDFLIELGPRVGRALSDRDGLVSEIIRDLGPQLERGIRQRPPFVGEILSELGKLLNKAQPCANKSSPKSSADPSQASPKPAAPELDQEGGPRVGPLLSRQRRQAAWSPKSSDVRAFIDELEPHFQALFHKGSDSLGTSLIELEPHVTHAIRQRPNAVGELLRELGPHLEHMIRQEPDMVDMLISELGRVLKMAQSCAAESSDKSSVDPFQAGSKLAPRELPPSSRQAASPDHSSADDALNELDPQSRLERARRQAPDSVGTYLSEVGAQMDKAQSSIESSAKYFADLFQPKSTPSAPKLPLLSRKRRQAAPSGGASAGDVLNFLADLGPQVERAQSSMKLLSSLFGSNSQPQQQPAVAGAPLQQLQPQQAQQGAAQYLGQSIPAQFLGPPPPQQPQPQPVAYAAPLQVAQQPPPPPPPAASNSVSGLQLVSQLSQLLRSTQANNAQQSVQNTQQEASQQVAAPVQNAQTGLQGTLMEIGQGLKRIATNNPSLISDVKSLYQTVSSKLTSASSSAAQAAAPPASPFSGPIVPAQNSEQLADNIGKAMLQGLQNPA